MNLRKSEKEAEKKLKSIINSRLLINLDKNRSRKEDAVLARMIYTKVLRDDGFTWPAIAFSINRNHSTIIYQYRTLVNRMKYEKRVERMFIEVRNDYWSDDEIIDQRNIDDLKNIIFDLGCQNKVLISRIKELESKILGVLK